MGDQLVNKMVNKMASEREWEKSSALRMVRQLGNEMAVKMEF